MAAIEFDAGVMDDIQRIIDHLDAYEVSTSKARASQIFSAIQVLADNPLIGRPAGDGKNELLIGRDASGYVALYRYLPMIDVVMVLGIRAQREAGYARP